MRTPDHDLGRREIGRRGLLLAGPVGLLGLATTTLGAGALGSVARSGADVFERAGTAARAAFGSPQVRQALDRAVLPVIGKSAVVSVSVLDRRTGTRWSHRGDELVQTGSVAKVLIAAEALRKAREAGSSLTPAQLEQVRLALTVSDNASADALYAYIGKHAGVSRVAGDLGLEATAAADTVPHWGNTLTSTDDLVRLMSALAGGSPVLHERDRAVILGHMAKVVDGQRWGVGTVRSASVRIHVKNGWMKVDKPWVINSVGDVTGDGRDYVMAILQGAQPDEETGMTRASKLGRAAFTALAP